MIKALLLSVLVASTAALRLPAVARPRAAATFMQEAADDDEAVPAPPESDNPFIRPGSVLNQTPADRDERAKKRELINRLLPGTALVALIFNYVSDGALGKLEAPATIKGPKGLEEARALKKRSEAKSNAYYSDMLIKDELKGNK